jgi:hypothetical protein
MRIFILSVATAAVLGLGWAYGLSSIQQSIANAEAGSSVRLDQQEAVNIYGRAGWGSRKNPGALKSALIHAVVGRDLPIPARHRL